MRKLTVKNFSVIEDAELEFGKITVLIGPESSGKSLLCTLAYFLGREVIEIAEGAIKAGGQPSQFSSFEKSVKKEFEVWFPRSTWGNQQWTLFFKSQNYEVTVSGCGNSTDEIAFLFCEKFHDAFAKSLTYFYPDTEYQPAYLLRGLSGQGVWDHITYIPSERAYFVETSKSYKILVSDPEPLIQRFALTYSNARDPKIPKPRMQHFLEGNLEQGEDEWKFVFEDGRIVPLGKLSSGSKELLPLFCVLEMYEYRRPMTKDQINHGFAPEDTYQSDEFYIEEPEGHIFPQAQREVVNYFAELANSTRFNTRITITTHSPYILSAFGNLIKAGFVESLDERRKPEVSKVLDNKYWIQPEDFAAYKIEDGKLVSIFDRTTGELDADYLDNVSGEIADEFSRLLELQYGE